MGFKQHISRTWQMIEQQVNDVPFRPDNEAVGLKYPAIGELRGLTESDRLEILQNILQFSPFILQNNAEKSVNHEYPR